MPESTPMAPLAAFRGQKPPAPAWFERVVAIEPERTFVAIDGAEVETLAWGERGKPGLIFLHGGAAMFEVRAHLVGRFFECTVKAEGLLVSRTNARIGAVPLRRRTENLPRAFHNLEIAFCDRRPGLRIVRALRFQATR